MSDAFVLRLCSLDGTGGRTLSCRDAVHDDLPALARIHIDAWRAAYVGVMDPLLLESLAVEHALSRLGPAMEPQPPLVVVVEHDRRIVGFCRFGPSRDADALTSTGEVFACNIAPGHWRKGFGRQLMSAALSRLAKSGYDVCRLWVVEQNHRARQFYSALCFDPDGTQRVEAATTA